MNNALFVTIYDQTPAQHELTKRAVESAMNQDVLIDLFLLDNGSTYEPTRKWIEEIRNFPVMTIQHYPENISPVKVVNIWLEYLFGMGHPHVLGIPNDVSIPPNFYRELLRWPRGVVAASMTSGEPTPCESSVAVNTCTPLCAALVRKWAYDALIAKDGYFFDPSFHMYASDCDLALRLSSCGIIGVQLDIQYHHAMSASHRLAPPDYSRRASFQADRDRAYFEKKWGFSVSDPRYSTTASDINFRGEPKEGT